MTHIAPGVWVHRCLVKDAHWKDLARVHLSTNVLLDRDGFHGKSLCGLLVADTLCPYETETGLPADFRPVDCDVCRSRGFEVVENLRAVLEGEPSGLPKIF